MEIITYEKIEKKIQVNVGDTFRTGTTYYMVLSETEVMVVYTFTKAISIVPPSVVSPDTEKCETEEFLSVFNVVMYHLNQLVNR